MLYTSTVLERKANKLDLTPCVISAVVCLSEGEYNSFKNNLLQDREFLSEYKDICGSNENYCHCLLVLNASGDDGILCDTEGYNYARYSAPFPDAKGYLNYHMQGIAERMVSGALENSPDGTWLFDYEDFGQKEGIILPRSTYLLELLQDKLLARDEVRSASIGCEGILVEFEPAFCRSMENDATQQESSIEIMWDDLKPAAQKRIINMLGDNGNYDVYPITTIYAEPNQDIQM